MKKLILTLSTILFAVYSHAVNLSTTGTGQVLIFPYYTVNNDINTLINLVNTTDQSKALRVRFREAANSREVFAFNLYLGPHDVWTGALVEDYINNEVITKIISIDNSCTIPDLKLAGQLFYNSNFTGDMSDAYGNSTNRMYEGFVEVIEMGVVTGDSAAATIMSNGVANCSVIGDAWDSNSGNPYWTVNPNTDMSVPTGGILGNLILIDVNTGIAITEEATALNTFSDEVLHFAVENDSPTLADGMTQSQINYNNTVYEFDWEFGFQAVSSILMKNSIANEYVLDDSIGSNTDWMISLPTRQFHTDIELTGGNFPLPPFTFINSSGIACEPFAVTGLYDREEQAPSVPPTTVIGLPPPGIEPFIPAFCHATNYLTMFRNDDTISIPQGIFGSHYVVGSLANTNTSTYGLRLPFQEGWVQFSFTGNPNSGVAQSMTIDDTSIMGLPIIGFSVQRYVNGNFENGVLANYAGIFNHKSTRLIQSDTTPTDVSSTASISADGTGQVLLFPYYTVRNGLNTLISLVNTTDEVKALKIRFNEGKNGRETLDFNIYLSPYDVWTAALISTVSTYPEEGQPTVKIITTDTSCTVPAINGQDFFPFAFTGAFDDGQGTSMERTQEGFFEIIEMGTVIGSDALAATHVGGSPASCATINGNWTPVIGQWIIDPAENILPPDGSGGLYGSVSLIDVAGGVDMTYDATAIVGYSTELQHTDPGSLMPNLSTGSNQTSLIETEQGFLEVSWDSPLDAVSSLFMYDEIINDYVINDTINASTDWVNTYPTKAFYTDPFNNNIVPLQPFTSVLTDDIGACEELYFSSYNREQQANAKFGPIPSPTPPGNYRFKHCYSVNASYVDDAQELLVDTNVTTSIFGSNLIPVDWIVFNGLSPIYHLNSQEGWMQSKLSDFDPPDIFDSPSYIVGTGTNGETIEMFGKPVLGFVAQKYVNGTLEGGVLANYAVINMNKGKRKIVVSSAKNN